MCPAATGTGLSRRRLDARLVPGLPAGSRLGGVRPHQCDRRQPRSHPRGGGARSEPGDPAVGIDFGAADDSGDDGRIGHDGARRQVTRKERRRQRLAVTGRTSLNVASTAQCERMKIRAGYEITYESAQPTPMVLMLSVHPRAWGTSPPRTASPSIRPSRHAEYRDDFDNICTRDSCPPGHLTIRHDFVSRHRRARCRRPRRRAGPGPGSARRCAGLPARQPLLRHRPALGHGLVHVRQRADRLGAGAGDLRPRAPAHHVRLRTPRRRAPPGTAHASSAACAGISRISPSRCAAA